LLLLLIEPLSWTRRRVVAYTNNSACVETAALLSSNTVSSSPSIRRHREGNGNKHNQ
jgi:hypothetical protein